ncbi:hypothetical protein EXIGLDRAFT_725061, partial [Exidia glandulosa HHB12029]
VSPRSSASTASLPVAATRTSTRATLRCNWCRGHRFKLSSHTIYGSTFSVAVTRSRRATAAPPPLLGHYTCGVLSSISP